MNVSSTTALTRELKPLEAPFLSTDDQWFLWLKHQILIYFYTVFNYAYYVLAERFSQDQLDYYLCKQRPPGA